MSRFLIQCSWAEVPHLDEAVKKDLLDSVPAYQRQARTHGIPELGAGAVYTVPVEDITVKDFQIPKEWPCAYGLDVGWNNTAAVWGAWDRQKDCIYLWNVYKRGHAEPVVHGSAIKMRGEWIPGVCDPAADTSNQVDGRKLLDIYRGLGLNIEPADHAVEAGILAVWNRLATGRLKVFASLAEFFAEYSLYRRSERGKIVKENDHILDACRYLVLSGFARAIVRPFPQLMNERLTYDMPYSGTDASLGWMGS